MHNPFEGKIYCPLDGVVIFENGLTLDQQIALDTVYKQNKGLMYRPVLRSGHSMNLQMLCFGKHWSAVDYHYHNDRRDVDQKPTPPMPDILVSIAKEFSPRVFPQYIPDWDIALMNHYNSTSTLGMHVDNSESQKTLAMGHPVVSFSIGANSIFRIGGLDRKDPYIDVLLKSGDVLVFGGSSRLRYHGIQKILSTEVNPDRINFTLRKY